MIRGRKMHLDAEHSKRLEESNKKAKIRRIFALGIHTLPHAELPEARILLRDYFNAYYGTDGPRQLQIYYRRHYGKNRAES